MTTATADNTQIIGGVDTHQDLHTAAVVSNDGTVLGAESFSTTRAGYRAMLLWFRSHGELLRVGVESTGTYGAGITRHLALSGIPVLEVTGPDPASRRAKGKDDTLDAIAAAEAARTRRRVQVAKDRSGTVEALRVLRTTRKTAIKCRRAALQQLHNTIVAAPEEVRDQMMLLAHGTQGKGYTVGSLSNVFRDMCAEAGLNHCSAHGLRKAGARRLAEHGATEWEVMAFLAHRTAKEASRYTAAANRAKLTTSGMAKLGADHEQILSNLSERLDKRGS